MSFWGDLKNAFVTYKEGTSREDILDLLDRTIEAFGGRPEYIKGTEKLNYVHTGMLDEDLKLIKKTVKKEIKKKKKTLKKRKKESPLEILKKLEDEIAELEQRAKELETK